MTARPVCWWEVPYHEQRQVPAGTLAAPAGRPDQRVACPKCHERSVVYNGNYFCEGYPPLEGGPGTCDWALAHPARSARDRALCDLIGLDYS